jgi:lipopolysaccharide assembly outer membrane protein LptD (OstA)
MESKIEYIVFGVILIFIGVIINVDSQKKESPPRVQEESLGVKKSTQISNFILYEINGSALIHTIKAEEAIEIANEWILKKPIISTEDVKYLRSDKSIVKKNRVIFIKNVKALKEDGTIYMSQKAIYYIDKKRLKTPRGFVIVSDKDKIEGKNLIYDVDNKSAKAHSVNGKFQIKKD